VPLPDGFKAPVADIVAALVRGDYESLDTDDRSGRVGADGLRRSVTEYGRTLVELPNVAFDLAESGEVSMRSGAWWVVVPLWTVEEGRSDLSLELSAIPIDGGHRFEIDDLHVLRPSECIPRRGGRRALFAMICTGSHMLCRLMRDADEPHQRVARR